MPLGRLEYLAPHFQAYELGADLPGSEPYLANIERLASYLEVVRTIVGSRLRVTSGWRAPTVNIQVGGAPDSAHLVGLAADVVPLDVSQFEAYRRLDEASKSGALPAWDQVVYYPVDGHIHVAIGGQLRREVRIKLYEGSGGTPLLTADLAPQLRGFV